MDARRTDLEDADRAVRAILRGVDRGPRRVPARVRVATALARAMGLDASEVAVIGHAATLRDVDLPSIDGREPLDDLSRELTRPLEAAGVVREVVLSQYEWWDGTGYPQGLSGDEIPIGGRVLAVVDAFDSLTQGFGGRTPLTRQEAMEELKKLSGRRFDPEVVSVFEGAWRDVEQFTRPGVSEAQESSQARDGR
jgi:HD-GYP domain-containing protein (c-di-GMP phosphodiesterase class II)